MSLVITWSEWAKQGLVTGYGVATERVTVIAPGVDVERWHRPNDRRVGHDGDPIRILFVGGDLRRKGGDLLIEAVCDDHDLAEVELHLVTTADVASSPGIVVHRGLSANSPELIDQYHRADIFCLPTLGDCLPMVLAEAAAAVLSAPAW